MVLRGSVCLHFILATMIARVSSFRYLRSRLTMARKSSSAPFSLDPINLSNKFPLPPDPVNFSDKFRIPVTNGKFPLEEQNYHPRDQKLEFDSSRHKYYFDNKPMDRSVTEVVSSYFEKFDADLVARRMTTGSNWPRAEYMQRSGEPMTEDEIKKKWAYIGEYARNTGIWMHFNIERYLNNLDTSPNSVEIPKFLKFYDDFIKGKMVPFRTEWRIAADDLGVAGSVDFVGKFDDGTYALIDWKRSKDLGSNLTNKYKKRAMYPLDRVDDCDGSKYYLQLNMYKYILEKYYDINVSYMAVASFHPSTGDSYFMTEVPNMENEIIAVFTDIQKQQEPVAVSAPKFRPQAQPTYQETRRIDDDPNAIPF